MNEDDWVTPVRTDVNVEARQAISDQVEAFLRKGGEIKVCGPEHNAQARFDPARSKAKLRKSMKEATYREMVRRKEFLEGD